MCGTVTTGRTRMGRRRPSNCPRSCSPRRKPRRAASIGSQANREGCNMSVFPVIFDPKQMVSYTVLNETYGRYPESPEQFAGKLFRVLSWSHLLEFTKRMTYASDEHPGALLHYEIACLNHVVDVICTGPQGSRLFVGATEHEAAAPDHRLAIGAEALSPGSLASISIRSLTASAIAVRVRCPFCRLDRHVSQQELSEPGKGPTRALDLRECRLPHTRMLS